MPTRILRPELFHFPADSFDAKKTLLQSLSPMLADSEVQRKEDALACEQFTRCKNIKVRKPQQSYEYIDIDTQTSVDYAEYEKR
jgi:hypothetical protein